MREFKARAWNPIEKKMYYTAFPSFVGDIIVLDENNQIKTLSPYSEKEPILMLFSGLYDKNHKEEYDGDIIKWRNIVGVYEWIDKFACFGLKSNNVYYYLQKMDEPNTEVIGNIHENPEFLEEKNAINQ